MSLKEAISTGFEEEKERGWCDCVAYIHDVLVRGLAFADNIVSIDSCRAVDDRTACCQGDRLDMLLKQTEDAAIALVDQLEKISARF